MSNPFVDALLQAEESAPPTTPKTRGSNHKKEIRAALVNYIGAKIDETDFISEREAKRLTRKAYNMFHTGKMPNGEVKARGKKKKGGKKSNPFAKGGSSEEEEEEEEVEVPSENLLKKWGKTDSGMDKLKALHAEIFGSKPRGQPKPETLIAKILETVE